MREEPVDDRRSSGESSPLSEIVQAGLLLLLLVSTLGNGRRSARHANAEHRSNPEDQSSQADAKSRPGDRQSFGWLKVAEVVGILAIASSIYTEKSKENTSQDSERRHQRYLGRESAYAKAEDVMAALVDAGDDLAARKAAAKSLYKIHFTYLPMYDDVETRDSRKAVMLLLYSVSNKSGQTFLKYSGDTANLDDLVYAIQNAAYCMSHSLARTLEDDSGLPVPQFSWHYYFEDRKKRDPNRIQINFYNIPAGGASFNFFEVNHRRRHERTPIPIPVDGILYQPLDRAHETRGQEIEALALRYVGKTLGPPSEEEKENRTWSSDDD